MVLPDDLGVLGEPSGDGTTVYDLKRHIDSAENANGHPEIALIGIQTTHSDNRDEMLRNRKANGGTHYIC